MIGKTSLVSTPVGYRYAESLKEGDAIYSFSSGKKMTKVSKVRKKRVSEIFVIELFSGETISCDAEAEFVSVDGSRVQANSLYGGCILKHKVSTAGIEIKDVKVVSEQELLFPICEEGSVIEVSGVFVIR